MILSSLLALLTLISLSTAQQNVTVNSTSPAIKYQGNAASVPFCQINPDGTISGSQGGCYNVPSHCSETAFVGQGGSGAASFSFNGTAIYITSLLDSLSPIYTVSLDGTSTDVDGVRQSAPPICSLLFSKTNLDPNIEHEIQLSVKGPSPTRNQSITGSANAYVFGLVSFVYTEGSVNGTSSNLGSNTTTTANSASASASTPGSSVASSSSVEGQPVHRFLPFGACIVLVGLAVML